MSEFRFHLTEARLWALSFPREAEELCIPLALRESSNPDNRDLAIYVVGIVAGKGNFQAEQVLLDLAGSESECVASAATSALLQEDPNGRHRQLYRKRARHADLLALDILGDWVDEDSKQVLQEIVGRDAGIERDWAGNSLSRILWLEAPNWANRITSILVARGGTALQDRDFDWALRVSGCAKTEGQSPVFWRAC